MASYGLLVVPHAKRILKLTHIHLSHLKLLSQLLLLNPLQFSIFIVHVLQLVPHFLGHFFFNGLLEQIRIHTLMNQEKSISIFLPLFLVHDLLNTICIHFQCRYSITHDFNHILKSKDDLHLCNPPLVALTFKN